MAFGRRGAFIAAFDWRRDRRSVRFCRLPLDPKPRTLSLPQQRRAKRIQIEGALAFFRPPGQQPVSLSHLTDAAPRDDHAAIRQRHLLPALPDRRNRGTRCRPYPGERIVFPGGLFLRSGQRRHQQAHQWQ